MKPTLAPWQFLSFYKSLLQWKTSQCKFLNFLKAANTSWNFKVKNYILLNLYKCVWMWNFFNPLIEKRPGQKFQAFYNWIIHPVKGKKDELFSKISLKFEKMNQDQFIFSFDFMHACVLSCFSHIQLFVILWTVACQGPLWDSPGKNIGVGCQALLQEIFPTQGLNLGLLWLLHCRQIFYCWATREAPGANIK